MNKLSLSISIGCAALAGSVSAAPSLGTQNTNPERPGPNIVWEDDMEASIAPSIDKYLACLRSRKSQQFDSPAEIVPDAERALRKCRAERSEAAIEADKRLLAQSGWHEKNKREAEINTTLDNTDAMWLKLARASEAEFRRLLKQQ